MTMRMCRVTALVVLGLSIAAGAQPSTGAPGPVKLADIRMRDVCILADAGSRTYYMVGAGRRSVQAYTSDDLLNWRGPQMVFAVPDGIWGDIRVIGIWAPELHAYKGKYYLFLTFDTHHELSEQWRDWLPRVTRGSQVLVADSPTGPFEPFANRSTLPTDMMTLDGTLWVENNVPYMVFCHEWVQIKNGTVEYVQLKDDLSETVGEPKRLFDGSDAPWSRKSAQYGCNVTDGPFLHAGKTGKLYMIWASHGQGGYTEGIAISASGKLAGPWTQQAEPLYSNDGGHGMLFTTFDGKLMMVLHSPNGAAARPRIFELQDTGDTLQVLGEFTGQASTAPPGEAAPAVAGEALAGPVASADPFVGTWTEYWPDISENATHVVSKSEGQYQVKGWSPLTPQYNITDVRLDGDCLKFNEGTATFVVEYEVRLKDARTLSVRAKGTSGWRDDIVWTRSQ